MTIQPTRHFGELLREWRGRRGMTQLALALRADVSARHVSFLETGRARPSREMVLTLAEQLDIPLRARNTLLLSAAFAPEFPDVGADASHAADMQRIIRTILAGHEPYPAVALDRHWNVVAANRAIAPLLACVAPELREPPVNVLRNSLHPRGMAERVLNYSEWRAHILVRLQRQIHASADPVLESLCRELVELTPGEHVAQSTGEARPLIAVPLRFKSPRGVLNLLSSTMVFGTALDVSFSEIMLETFYPMDAATAHLLHELARASASAASS
jgi:transcriptional regulator with XRE-family HTH domain